MKRTFTLLAAALMASSMLCACAGKQAGQSSSAAPSASEAASGAAESAPAGEGKQYTIGLSMNTQTNPFFVDVKNGVQKAADEDGVQLYITDAQNDPSIQMKDIENLITKKPDAIIIDTCDSDAIVSSVEACNQAGIPVFTMDRQANGGEVVAHIGYDAIKSGKIAGQFLVDQLGGKGNIVEIQGIMGTNVAQNRSKGFNEVIAEHPDMKIVATAVANFDRAEAMSVVENILQANPKIDGMYCANDEMLLGALEAVEAAGRADQIVMIGCDAIDDTLAAIKAKRVEATIAEPPFFLGKAILMTAVDHLNGKPVEKEVILENSLVTQENVNTLVTKE